MNIKKNGSQPFDVLILKFVETLLVAQIIYIMSIIEIQ